MSVDPLADAPGVAEAKGCHSYFRKRTLDETMEDAAPGEAKRPRTIAPQLLNLKAFPIPPQLNQPPSLNTYQPVHGCDEGVYLRAVDYTSLATNVESPQLSPKTLVASMPVHAENDGIKEKQTEGWSSVDNQLLTPTTADAALNVCPATPLSHWSESAPSVKSLQEFLAFSQNFAIFPTSEPRPSYSSMTAHFRSLSQEAQFQDHMPIYSPCQCSTFHQCPSHRDPYGRQPCVSSRRPSSMTLPVCFQDHPAYHDTSMGPHTTPLPVEPGAWAQTMRHHPLHSAPLTSPPSCHQGMQTTPSVISNCANSTEPLSGVPTWTGEETFRHPHEESSVLSATTADKMSIGASGDAATADSQPQQDALEVDAGMDDSGTDTSE